MTLPPFPVDDNTLDLLMAAVDPWTHGDPDARSSSVADFLEFMSELGGSDVHAVSEVLDDGSRGHVVAALVDEVRRLRHQLAATNGAP